MRIAIIVTGGTCVVASLLAARVGVAADTAGESHETAPQDSATEAAQVTGGGDCELGATDDAAASPRIGNAGPVIFTLNTGSFITIRSQPPFAIGGATGTSFFRGSVGGGGTLAFPMSGVHVDAVKVPFSSIAFDVNLVATAPITGSIDPISGEVTANATFRANITGPIPFLPATCAIPTLHFVLTTGAEGGVPYNAKLGTASIADADFVVPAATDCGFYTGIINSALKLPSPAHASRLKLVLTSSPVVTPAP